MLTRRELASIAWYGALFSAVVGWAMLHSAPAVAPVRREAEPSDDERGELHRAVRRVAGP
jgi:hypothetical protein